MDSEAPEEFILPSEVRDALLRYLVGRPYAEVAEGIAMLQALRPASKEPSDSLPSLTPG